MKNFFYSMVFIWIFSPFALALKLKDLYTIQLPAKTQSEVERNVLAKEGLEQVLMKVSGDAHIFNHQGIKDVTIETMRLIDQYRYIQNNPNYLLEFQFNPRGIDQLLKNANEPIWGVRRPLIMVWLTYQDETHDREIVAEDSTLNFSAAFKQAALKTGLPVIFPTMDAQELVSISSNDIMNSAIPSLTEAAKRYGSDGLLLGQMNQKDSLLMSHWTLLLADNQWNWQVSGAHASDVFDQIVDLMSHTLAKRYANVSEEKKSQSIILKVTGITEAGDFDRLMNYLKQLTAVSEVDPIELKSEEISLKIKLNSSKEAFTESLTLSQRLVPQLSESEDETLLYQWNR